MIIKYDNRNLKEKARPNENDNKRIKTRNKVAIERMMRERPTAEAKMFYIRFCAGQLLIKPLNSPDFLIFFQIDLREQSLMFP